MAVQSAAVPQGRSTAATKPRQVREHLVRPWLGCTVGLTLLIGVALLSLMTGPIAVPLNDLLAIIGKRALGLPVGESVDVQREIVTWNHQLPRVLLVTVVGAGLALAGVACQALVRNALAEPYILGVSSGATLGTVVMMAAGIGFGGVLGQGGGAVLGALGALLLVLAFGRSRGVTSPLRVILAGIAIGHLLIGVTGYLVITYITAVPEDLSNYLVLNPDSLKFSQLWLPLAALPVGYLILRFDAARMNALLVGDETAASLGIRVNLLRLRLVLVIALLAGVMVAQVGLIAFVGLVVPHIVRLMVGSDHRHVITLAAILGAAYLVSCDYVAHHLTAPRLLPLSLVAGSIGAPVFLWLLRRGMASNAA